jgi:hypothetical protein
LLTPLFKEIQPDIIYAPSCVDFHPEHKKVALTLGSYLRSIHEDSPRMSIRVYQVHVPLTPFLTNLISPVGSVMDRIRKALKTYATQSGSTDQPYRLRIYAGKYYGISSLVEEFWAISPAKYAYIHIPRNSLCFSSDFKGLLPNPSLDPYIYIHGALRRRQIANLSKVDIR